MSNRVSSRIYKIDIEEQLIFFFSIIDKKNKAVIAFLELHYA